MRDKEIELQLKVLEGHLKKVNKEFSSAIGQLNKLKEMFDKNNDVRLKEIKNKISKNKENCEDLNEFWNKVLDKIKNEVEYASFETWFKKSKLIKRDKQKITIQVENEFHAEWLESRYYDLIVAKIAEISDDIVEIDFVIE